MTNTIERRKALMKMTDTARVVNMLSGKNLYSIPYAHIREMSIGDMERMNKKWLKKVKPKKRMTKKEYRRWKNKMKGLGVA